MYVTFNTVAVDIKSYFKIFMLIIAISFLAKAKFAEFFITLAILALGLLIEQIRLIAIRKGWVL